ncbi:methyl-accepting chemotaxis protein [Rhodoblastus sphagnicola]|nr:methyl-accepting chemotaxis protein [Rhodoblastus sphagnicola]MBB4197684.1 methyl-accepting chemotaxis protein [Rhodoblastus sphagnicola]
MFAAIANLRIFTKISLGIAGVLGLLAAASTWNYVSMSRIDALFAEYRDKADVMTLADKLLQDMTSYGFVAQTYARTGDEALMDKSSEIGGVVNEDVATLRKAIHKADRIPLLDRADQKNQELAQKVSDIFELRGAAADGHQSETVGGAAMGNPIENLAADIARQSDELGADASALVAGLRADEVEITRSTGELIDAALRNILLALGLGIGGGLAIAYGVGRTISKPINAMTAVMELLANGKSIAAIPYAERTDEVGKMARAVAVFEQNLEENAKLRQDALDKEAQSRQAQRAQTIALSDHFEQAVGGVIASIGTAAEQLSASVEALSHAMEDSAAQATSVTSATQAAAAKVNAMAAASEQLSASIAEIAQQFAQTQVASAAAAQEAEQSKTQFDAMSLAADQIGGATRLINSIAQQTNMLALNATIEAARAGDAGRGFAVVAQEVKALATQTGDATESIGHQMLAVQQATQTATRSICAIAETTEVANRLSASIAAVVEQQSAATQEIAANASQTSLDVRAIAVNITSVQEATTTSRDACGRLRSAAGALAEQADHLRQEMHSVLQHLRAA